jgi:hypothetical protein
MSQPPPPILELIERFERNRERTALDRQITATDTQLDKLVYDLCGLTDAEITIVEAS